MGEKDAEMKAGLERFAEIDAGYRLMHDDPEGCRPMFLIQSPVAVPSWEECLADPLVMLRAELDKLEEHFRIGDDHTPTVRVEFGTAQIAAAFGCEMFIPKDNLPCAGSHVLKEARDVRNLSLPGPDAGWMGKLREWTEVFKANLPPGIHIQHPDIQSPFNTAHLIRGNGIFTDIYDDPAAMGELLDKVTDYLIGLVPRLKAQISDDPDWFHDWGALWKGAARISNCTMHLISARHYIEHVLPRDARLMKAIGGGRVHYCGTHGAVIEEFFRIPEISGLDYDSKYHDLWELSELAPRGTVLLAGADRRLLNRLLAGDWPKKRNLIIQVWVRSADEGRELLKRLRESVKS